MRRSDSLERSNPNPYRDPKASRRRPTGRGRTGRLLWSVLLSPYVAYATVVVAVIGWNRLGWTYSEGFRETVIAFGSGLGSGTVLALFLWPAAYLFEQVLRRSSASRSPSRFRYLALGALTAAIYFHVPIAVLAARGVLSDEHPLVGASKLVSGIATFAAVPLFLAWVVLVVVQRRR